MGIELSVSFSVIIHFFLPLLQCPLSLSSMQCPWLLLLLLLVAVVVVVVRSHPCDAPPSAYVLLRVGGGDHRLAQPKFSIERISSFEEFFNAHYPEHPLYFDGQDKERTKSELSMVQDQSSGVNHQFQFIADAESNASNTLNSGYHGYNNENLVLNNMTRQVELNMENLYNQNFGVLDEEFGIAYAPITIKQDHVLQSQSVVKNYEELPFDASILHIGFEGCTPGDCPELPNNMKNDKRGEASTSTKQNLVAVSPLTNESPGVLSKEERRKQSNRESQKRCRERKETRVNELEATAKLFNEVKPLLLKILATDTGNIVYEVRKQLEDLIVKDQYAAIAFGMPAILGFNHTSQVAGAKMKRSHSMVRVGSYERLLKRRSGM